MSADWPSDFPPVTSLVSYADLRHNPDPALQEFYDKAKNHEDREAAAELIDRLVSDEGIERIKALASEHPGAVLVSVHAVEGQGRNTLPQTLAYFIAGHTGLEVDDTIVQAGIVSKTGIKSSWERLTRRTQFEGNVEAGKDYILIDDVFSAGGTFSDLRQFIEQNGGKVVDTLSMANGAKSFDASLAVTIGHILELEKKFGIESLQQFLKEEALYDGNYKALTDAEARTLLGTPTLDEARDRMAQARQEGNRRVRPEVVQRTSPDPQEVTPAPEIHQVTDKKQSPHTSEEVDYYRNSPPPGETAFYEIGGFTLGVTPEQARIRDTETGRSITLEGQFDSEEHAGWLVDPEVQDFFYEDLSPYILEGVAFHMKEDLERHCKGQDIEGIRDYIENRRTDTQDNVFKDTVTGVSLDELIQQQKNNPPHTERNTQNKEKTMSEDYQFEGGNQAINAGHQEALGKIKTTDRKETVEYILLGGKYGAKEAFTVIETPGKITFYDGRKKDALTFSGNLDAAAIKKDLAEYFNNSSLSVGLIDIGGYVSNQKQKGNELYSNIESTERNRNYTYDGMVTYGRVNKTESPEKLLSNKDFENTIETAKKAGYVQGVCECVAIAGSLNNYTLGKQMLSQMNVSKDMAKKYANPETYKALEGGIFKPHQEQKLEQQQSRGRGL